MKKIERFEQIVKLREERFGDFTKDDLQNFYQAIDKMFDNHRDVLNKGAVEYINSLKNLTLDEKASRIAKSNGIVDRKYNRAKEMLFNRLLDIFNDGITFGAHIQENSWMAKDKNFAYYVVVLNPNLIYYFSEDVRKDAKILDYIAQNAALTKDLRYPKICFDKGLVEDGIVKFKTEKQNAIFKKRADQAAKEDEKKAPHFSKKTGDFSVYRDERKNCCYGHYGQK